MTKEEIQSLIEEEEKILAALLKIIEKYQIKNEAMNRQIDFHLDKINELSQLLKKL